MGAYATTPTYSSGVDSTDRYIQAASFEDYQNAKELEDVLKGSYPNTHIERKSVNNMYVYRVKIGPFADVNSLANSYAKVKSEGLSNAITVSK